MSDEGLTSANVLAPEQVAEFLASHPEFFLNRDELLSRLTIPHQRGSAVSLVERQLAVLRERNQTLRERLNNLLSIARDNDRLFGRVRRFVLSVMEAQTLDALVDVVDDSLSHEFRIEYVSQFLVSDVYPDLSRIACYPASKLCNSIGVADLFSSKRVVCGQLSVHGLKFLFPNHWKLVRSVAVVPLYYHQPLGTLVVGSRDQDTFQVSAGTDYLEFLGEVLSRVLAAFADQGR